MFLKFLTLITYTYIPIATLQCKVPVHAAGNKA